MSHAYTYAGQCHCGSVRVEFASSKPADEIDVRACQCSFCTRQGAMTISDPEGRATLAIERAALTRYQFGTRSGASLVCGKCGTYAAVVLEDGGRAWSSLNVRGLAIPEFLARTPSPVVYDGETAEARIARRKIKWTPTDITYS